MNGAKDCNVLVNAEASGGSFAAGSPSGAVSCEASASLATSVFFGNGKSAGASSCGGASAAGGSPSAGGDGAGSSVISGAIVSGFAGSSPASSGGTIFGPDASWAPGEESTVASAEAGSCASGDASSGIGIGCSAVAGLAGPRDTSPLRDAQKPTRIKDIATPTTAAAPVNNH
jgi:hypothetical protein